MRNHAVSSFFTTYQLATFPSNHVQMAGPVLDTSEEALGSSLRTRYAANDAVERYCALSHREQNASGTSTVVFIHGAFGSSISWDVVTPHLSKASDYHILLPDLPSHGFARDIGPFSISIAAHLISELIARRAHNGVAKLVGLSLGADVALRVASDFPDVVDKNGAFVSGASTPIPRGQNSTSQYLPYGAWLSQRIEWLAPRPLIRSLMGGTDLPRPTLSNCTLELNAQIFAPDDSKWPSAWPAKTLIVAAGKRGLLPTDDNADTARRRAEIGRKGNEGTLAVVHYGMRHPWSLQAPELFAQAVEAWFSDGKVLEGFAPL
jgi:pimeloyl-ACP methyl ester carboxylesterase